MINIKGYEFDAITIKDSFNRRAQKFKNNIIEKLRSVGVPSDDVIIDLEPVAIKRLPASATWYIEGSHSHFSYKAGSKYVDNLYVVSKIIEFEVKAVLSGEKTIDEFIADFTESHEIEEERKWARELLGFEEDSLDFEGMHAKYKQMAKDLHPDMPNGDLEKFKELNRAHKILKRELK
ncbi:J domain-containing protein [Candidatus Woesearchaeota archaeon]|nr:J domain-containing protein [Candidatus Woesearchaeota archaeon]